MGKKELAAALALYPRGGPPKIGTADYAEWQRRMAAWAYQFGLPLLSMGFKEPDEEWEKLVGKLNGTLPPIRTV